MVPIVYNYKGKVTAVIDGDTVDIEIDIGFKMKTEQRLRLARINTPEMHDPDPELQAKALAAKKFVERKVLKKDVIITTRKTDLYGRYVAEIYFGEAQANLNDLLLATGHAKKYGK